MKSKILYDARWCKAGGIGRFASAMLESQTCRAAECLNGGVGDILSPRDPVKLRLKKYDWFISPGYNAPFGRSHKSVITVHDLMHLKFPEYRSLKNTLYYNMIVKPACENSPLVFTVSNFTKDEICSWLSIPEERVVVVPNAVDFNVDNQETGGFYNDRPYFLYVGNDKEHKNLPILIKSFSIVSNYRDVDLILVGNIEYNKVMGLAKALSVEDRVYVKTSVSDEGLVKLYRSALATCLISLYEGFGIPILESMSLGTPVIATNFGACSEVASDAALLVDPRDVENISHAMLELFDDSAFREELVGRSIEVAKKYSWNESRNIWDEAIKGKLLNG